MVEDLTHFRSTLSGQLHAFKIDVGIRQFQRVRTKVPYAAIRAVTLKQDMVTDRIHVSTEALRLLNPVIMYGRQNPHEGLLDHILSDRKGNLSNPQLDAQQIAKVFGKMPFSFKIALPETIEIDFLKDRLRHAPCPRTPNRSRHGGT